MAEVRPSDILYRVGGRTLQRTGALVGRRGTGLLGTLEPTLTWTRNLIGMAVDRGGVLRPWPVDAARIEYVDLDGDGIRETATVVSESQRQNLVLRSEELDNAAWAKNNVTVDTNHTVAPDGTTTAERVLETTASAGHNVAQNGLAYAAGSYVALSMFLKPTGRTRLRLLAASGTDQFGADVNLTTAVVTDFTANAGTVVHKALLPLANGWYRLTVAGRTNASATSADFSSNLLNDTGDPTYVGDVTKGMWLWGGQMEVGRYATSYIKTTTAAVTRGADTGYLANIALTPGVTDITLFARIARPLHADVTGALGSVWPGWGGIGDGTTASELGSFFEESARSMESVVRFSGSPLTQAQITGGAIPSGTSLAACSQFRLLTTAPATRIDVGNGFSAWSSATTPFVAYGSTRINVGSAFGQLLDGGLIELIVARGQFSRDEMLAVP